jgi:hypothetical protein
MQLSNSNHRQQPVSKGVNVNSSGLINWVNHHQQLALTTTPHQPQPVNQLSSSRLQRISDFAAKLSQQVEVDHTQQAAHSLISAPACLAPNIALLNPVNLGNNNQAERQTAKACKSQQTSKYASPRSQAKRKQRHFS